MSAQPFPMVRVLSDQFMTKHIHIGAGLLELLATSADAIRLLRAVTFGLSPPAGIASSLYLAFLSRRELTD